MKIKDKYNEEIKSIMTVGERLYNRNMLAAADGNISVRVKDGVLITASGKCKAFLEDEDFALIDFEGNVVVGEPSSESQMHLEVYKNCAMAKAVIHAHPPHAIAWSVAFPDQTELPSRCLSEVIIAAGTIPIAPYARPGGGRLAESIAQFAADHKLIIMQRHGAIAWGETVSEAIMGMERLEHSAEILYKAKTLGELTELPPEELKELWKIREGLKGRTV